MTICIYLFLIRSWDYILILVTGTDAVCNYYNRFNYRLIFYLSRAHVSYWYTEDNVSICSVLLFWRSCSLFGKRNFSNDFLVILLSHLLWLCYHITWFFLYWWKEYLLWSCFHVHQYPILTVILFVMTIFGHVVITFDTIFWS